VKPKTNPINPVVPYGFCACGCGTKTNLSRKGKPNDWCKSHHTRITRWEKHYDIDTETGCWNWNRSRNRLGYGRTTPTAFGTQMAHRVVYMSLRGPIPDDLPLDHLCRNTSCVNPEHLEPVTVAENSRRGLSTVLTFEEAKKIKVLLKMGKTIKEIEALFPVKQTAIADIRRGRTWRDA